ncbi:MAG: hypothetical protein L0207_05350 [Chlamydiae bacterium]|nr:hypothetical protein [Chlamydiota bacterium]
MNFLSYLFIRILTFPIPFLSYRMVHKMGNVLGIIAYHLLTKFRKKTLSNLALAKTFNFSEDELIEIAKGAFQNLMITCLEYPKLAKEKDIHNVATCENPEQALEILRKGKGVIFFCGHQSNWEVLFLEGTSRMPGVAIGRPIKNQFLYRWILSIREKYGGKIITPKEAIKEGLRGLKKGAFLGIVGDQGMPDSGFSSIFLGRMAWTSSLPALLSYKTGVPIMVATTRREMGRYIIHYSEPIFPDQEQLIDNEIRHLMEKALKLFEENIRQRPSQWLWQHNRWKQQTLDKLKKRFRQDAIGIFLPQDPAFLQEIARKIGLFRELYPTEFIALYLPRNSKQLFHLKDVDLIEYDREEDLKKRDYRLKLIFNFTPYHSLKRHFLHLSAFDILSLDDLKKIAKIDSNDLSKIIKTACLKTAII